MQSVKKNLWLIGLLIIIGCSIYASNLYNPLFWDDDDWIINNAFVHHLSWSNIGNIFSQNILKGFGLNSNYYRPALLLSFMANYLIHGIKPLGYHLVSNGFHIANGLLVFLLLIRVTKNKVWSFSAAMLFLIHPAQVEAVTYISGRGDPMSVFFMLLALWLFLDFDSKNKKFLLALSLASFVIAILSRETAVLFPALLGIFYFSFINRDNLWTGIKKFILKAWPYSAMAAFYGILRLTVLNFQNTLNFYQNSNLYTEHLLYRLYTFGHALAQYARILLIPTHLHMERELAISTSLWQWPVWLAALAILFVASITIWLYKKGNRVWFFGWAWFFISLAPVSGIVPINALIYEHWLYLPLIGVSVMFGYFVSLIYQKQPKLVVAILILYFVFLGFLSSQRNLAWGKPIEFYEDTLRYNPTSIRMLNNLGNLYSAKGDLNKAVGVYQKAILLPGGAGFAQPYYNLGNVYRDKGDYQDAINQYVKAINVDPNFPFAYQNLAATLIDHKDFPNAIKVLQALKKIQPDNAQIDHSLEILRTMAP